MNTGKIWVRMGAVKKPDRIAEYVKVVSDILYTASNRPKLHNNEVVIVEMKTGERAVMMLWELQERYIPTVHDTFLAAQLSKGINFKGK